MPAPIRTDTMPGVPIMTPIVTPDRVIIAYLDPHGACRTRTTTWPGGTRSART